MIFARREMVIGPAYNANSTFELGPDRSALRLSLMVKDESIILFPSENEPPIFNNPTDLEIELDKGFHSLEFLTPIHGFRLKSSKNNARVSFRAYS